MTNNKTLLMILGAAVLLACAVFLMVRVTAPAPELLGEGEPAPKPAAEAAVPSLAATPAASAPVAAATQSPEHHLTPAVARAEKPGPAPSALARVNGVAITTKDLVAGRGREPLEPETAQGLLEAAIDRQLILEAAQARGLKLRADQEETLDKYRNELRNNEAYTTSRDSELRARMEAELDFQLRDLMAQMFLPVLMGQPKEIALATRASQEETTRNYLAGLRAGAKIER